MTTTTERPSSFAGQHCAPDTTWFEVFRCPEDYVLHHDNGRDRKPGWYWWSCMPGCLPDSVGFGPFPTAEGAYLDAIGD